MLLNSPFGREVLDARRTELAQRHHDTPIHLVRYMIATSHGGGGDSDEGDLIDIPLHQVYLGPDRILPSYLQVNADGLERASIWYRIGRVLESYSSSKYVATIVGGSESPRLVHQERHHDPVMPLSDDAHEFLVEASIEAIDVNAERMALYSIKDANDLADWDYEVRASWK